MGHSEWWGLRFSGNYPVIQVSMITANTLPSPRASGDKYRSEVLRHGGGKPPRAMVGEYLGKEVTPLGMVQALTATLRPGAPPG